MRVSVWWWHLLWVAIRVRQERRHVEHDLSLLVCGVHGLDTSLSMLRVQATTEPAPQATHTYIHTYTLYSTNKEFSVKIAQFNSYLTHLLTYSLYRKMQLSLNTKTSTAVGNR